jgi:hypothetical protein
MEINQFVERQEIVPGDSMPISDANMNRHRIYTTRFAAAGHDHVYEYAAIDHNHDDVYAAIDHNHDDVYAAIDHNHDDTYLKIEDYVAGILPNYDRLYGVFNVNQQAVIASGSIIFADGTLYTPAPDTYALPAAQSYDRSTTFYCGLVSGEFALSKNVGDFDIGKYAQFPGLLAYNSSTTKPYAAHFWQGNFRFDTGDVRQSVAHDLKETFSVTAGNTEYIANSNPTGVGSLIIWLYLPVNCLMGVGTYALHEVLAGRGEYTFAREYPASIAIKAIGAITNAQSMIVGCSFI